MITRRTLLAGVGTTLLTGALVGCSSDSSESSGARLGALTIGLSYVPDIQFAPYYVASELGYFTEAGVDVTLRHHGASESLFGALSDGTEQVLMASGDELLQAAAGGQPGVYFTQLYARYPVGLITRADSGIANPADLRGKRIGTPGQYGGTWFALLALLAAAGLSRDDVDIQFIGFTQQAALSTGKVDAVMGFTSNDAVRLQAAGTAVRILEVPDNPLISLGLVATPDTADQRGPALTAVSTAVLRAIATIKSDPARAVELSAKHIPAFTGSARTDAALVLDATLAMYGDGRTNLDQWQRMDTFMAKQQLIEKALSAEQLAALATNDLLG